jgi:hypothetical protein
VESSSSLAKELLNVTNRTRCDSCLMLSPSNAACPRSFACAVIAGGSRWGLRAIPKRRRLYLFLGSLIADDSLEVLRAVASEAYDVFHTVEFMEGNNKADCSTRGGGGILATVRTHVPRRKGWKRSIDCLDPRPRWVEMLSLAQFQLEATRRDAAVEGEGGSRPLRAICPWPTTRPTVDRSH